MYTMVLNLRSLVAGDVTQKQITAVLLSLTVDDTRTISAALITMGSTKKLVMGAKGPATK